MGLFGNLFLIWFNQGSLVLMCRRTTCDIVAGTWDTVPTYENIRRRQQQPSQAFTADVPAKILLERWRKKKFSKRSRRSSVMYDRKI